MMLHTRLESRGKEVIPGFKNSTESIRVLVHLDLKGAPPRLCYLKNYFKMLAKWGVTGVLIEWEDCFPYKGNLEGISNKIYSTEDAVQIIQDIRDAKLEVIPLLQTFGHLEFVLKHGNFVKYREVPLYPSSLCPSHPHSLALISALLDQVIPLHGDIKHFHIGADEVWHLALCDRCKLRIEAGESKEDLLLKHIKNVLEMIKMKWPDLNLIMWDDMLRGMDESVILAYGLPLLVEPMIWHYNPADSFSLPPDIWRKYACFPGVWTAGAFKGASGGSQLVPPTGHHASNILQWTRCFELIKTPCNGFVLTGWSRYDHFASLCETLPCSLLSLGICLRTYKERNFSPEAVTAVETELRLPDLVLLGKSSEPEEQMLYASWQIMILTTRLMSLRQSTNVLLSSDQLQTWMNDWQVENNIVNPMQVVSLVPVLNSVIDDFDNLERALRDIMFPIFFPSVIDEWIGTYIKILRSRAKGVLDTTEKVIAKATKFTEDASRMVEMDY